MFKGLQVDTDVQGDTGRYRCILSPKFKGVSLNETPEFPVWGLNICVDFHLRDGEYELTK